MPQVKKADGNKFRVRVKPGPGTGRRKRRRRHRQDLLERHEPRIVRNSVGQSKAALSRIVQIRVAQSRAAQIRGESRKHLSALTDRAHPKVHGDLTDERAGSVSSDREIPDKVNSVNRNSVTRSSAQDEKLKARSNLHRRILVNL